MKFNIVLILYLNFYNCFAQEAISTSSGEANGLNATVAFTIGQLFTSSSYSQGSYISEGIHQPFEISSTLSISTFYDQIQLQYYPNPIKNILHLVIPNWNKDTYKFTLFDFKGSILKTGTITTERSQIQFYTLPSASYVLKIKSNNQTVKAFTIIKN
jgi:hypothetical protein